MQVVNLTQVIHPLELLGDRHGTSRLNCDYHPDCVAKEVPSGLTILMMTTKSTAKQCTWQNSRLAFRESQPQNSLKLQAFKSALRMVLTDDHPGAEKKKRG